MTFEQIMQNEGFVPNKEQKQVIDSIRNTVVSAGAGAGKTAVLSWRFLKLVMDCGARPDQILTLTFTKKAASEMRERIYKRLLEAKDSLDPGALKSFGNATISTMDSFCSQIVRSDCISYGLPRDIGNLSDDDLDILSRRLAEKFLSDPENQEETETIASYFMPSAVMKDFFSEIAKNVSITGTYDARAITERLLVEIRAIYAEKRSQLMSMMDTLGRMRLTPGLQKQYAEIKELLETESLRETDYFNLRGVKDEEVKDFINNEVKTILSKESNFYVLQDIATTEDCEYSDLQVAVEKYANMLVEEKRHNGLLNFNDVSDLAVCILRDNLKVREIFKKRYKFIMIDEFQDNNSKQRDLLFLLAEKEGHGTAGLIPTINEIDENKLFFVGDEKQSIYKFRGAEVSVFRRLQDEIALNGNSLSLGINYRSQAKLINHFNYVFNKVLGDAKADYCARFAAIEAGREADDTRSRIILSVYDKGSLDDGIDSEIHEANVIADYCYRAIYTDDFLVAGKRLKPEEISIIFRSAGNQMNIEKALKRRGIPYQITETRSLMLEAVAGDFCSYLNVLLYPEDLRSRMALLRSPFCGLCDESLIHLVKDGTEVCSIDAKRYQAFIKLFSRLETQAFRMTIPQLLETLYIEGGYKAFLESSEQNLSFVEHYEYLYSYAVKFESEGKGLSDYARFLRRQLGNAKKLPECSVLHRESTGVQIMTVHKSKGLEFKLVIFADLGRGESNEESRYVFRHGEDIVATENRAIQKLLDSEYKEEEAAELKRVMYVALTRAKEHIVLVGGYKEVGDGEKTPKRMSAGNLLMWYSDAVGFDYAEGTCTCPDVVVENIKEFGPAVYDGDSSVIDKTALPPFRNKVSRISVTDLEAQNKNNDYSYDHPLPSFPADVIVGQGGLYDRFGTLCHYVLECLVGTGSYEDVKCDICQSDTSNGVLLDQAKAFADGFLASELYSTRVKGHDTKQEVRFYTCQEDPEAPVLEGVIDLLVLGDEHNLVIDYKTDSYRNPGQHKMQVLTYIKAAEEIYGKKCYGCLFYLRDSSVVGFWDRQGNMVEN